MSKIKCAKVKTEPDSSDSETERDLTHYVGNRLQLMQKVFKLIKPKKLATMAPECMKDKSVLELKGMLLEELLGISNKRLCRIFNGEKLEESSSTDSEAEKKLDVISLDDITEDSDISLSDENCMEINLSKREQMEIEKHKSKRKLKNKMNAEVKIKKEKSSKSKKKSKTENCEEEDPVMNVLNLLELQARARAIRSQLELEKSAENNEDCLITASNEDKPQDEDKSPNSVILISPKNSPVIVNNSDSDTEKCGKTIKIKTEKLTADEQKKLCKTNEKTEVPDDDILIVSEQQEICE